MIAFHHFWDIGNPGSCAVSYGRLLLNSKIHPSYDPIVNFTEWWNIGEGETMRVSFEVWDELVAGLLHALEMVHSPFLICLPKIDQKTIVWSWWKYSCYCNRQNQGHSAGLCWCWGAIPNSAWRSLCGFEGLQRQGLLHGKSQLGLMSRVLLHVSNKYILWFSILQEVFHQPYLILQLKQKHFHPLMP
jgi:hypothetical protein